MKNDNEDPVNARPKADTRWKPGQSGNPKGMKRGSRHKASLLAESLFDGEADRLSRRCILSALQGDVQAMKLCIERILPPIRERPCKFKLPKLQTLNDASNALALIIAGASSGELLPSEAESLANVVNGFAKLLELAEIETRLCALEKASGGAPADGRAYDA